LATGRAVFLDTSIQIDRLVGSADMKRKIALRVEEYDVATSGLTVRLEFRRRLLKEAEYLLLLLEEKGTVTAVQRHLQEVLTARHSRKLMISLAVLNTWFESGGDLDATDRAREYLRFLLLLGEDQVFAGVEVGDDGACGCGRASVRELTAYRKYDFGIQKCSKARECDVEPFLAKHREKIKRVVAAIDDLPQAKRTEELARTRRFFADWLRTGVARSADPCTQVGDALICVESARSTSVYSKNRRESSVLCAALGQEFVFRPKNPKHEDVVCPAGDEAWDERLASFGA